MSLVDDVCSAVFPKEWRMDFAKKFILACFRDPEMLSTSGRSLDLLTYNANGWIQESVGSDQRYPIISS